MVPNEELHILTLHFEPLKEGQISSVIHFKLRKEDSLPTRDKMADSKVSFPQRFHCNLVCNDLATSIPS